MNIINNFKKLLTVDFLLIDKMTLLCLVKHFTIKTDIINYHSLPKSMTLKYVTKIMVCPVDWGCRIHRLLLCRGVRPPPQ